MPRKTRRRIRRKRVRGTRRVRTYYRGGNRRYNGEGGIFGEENIGEENNVLTNTARQLRNFADRSGATNFYKKVSDSTDNILKKVGLKPNDSQFFH
jgi:hypothetical protein